MWKRKQPFLHWRACHDQLYNMGWHATVTILISKQSIAPLSLSQDVTFSAAINILTMSQWNHIVTRIWRGRAPIPTNNSILLYPPGICCDHRNMIVFILCLCPEPTGQVVADHRLLCDTEVKLITHDFLAWPNRYLQKSTPACHPAVGEPALYIFTLLIGLA